jgi:hypothetical protein
MNRDSNENPDRYLTFVGNSKLTPVQPRTNLKLLSFGQRAGQAS